MKEAFDYTAKYDALIAEVMSKRLPDGTHKLDNIPADHWL